MNPLHLVRLTERLEAELALAAADARVPGVIAAVRAPRIGLDWQAAAPGRFAPQAACTPQTPFRIASVTKLFTAAAVLRLVEEGALTLESPLRGHIDPATAALLAAGGHDVDRITLSQLLSHTSGLPDHTHAPSYASDVFDTGRRVWTRREQISIAASMGPPDAEPGTRFAYSDTGYVILGEVIERASGRSIAAAVRALLGLDALGLQSTWWERLEPARGDTPARQACEDRDQSHVDPSFDLFGGGGLVSTVGDLGRFMRALLRGEVLRGETLAAGLLVPPALRAPGDDIHGRLAMALPMGAAWGWGHLGFWGCGVVHCPELDVSVAATINQPYPQTANLRRALIARLGELAVDAVREARR